MHTPPRIALLAALGLIALLPSLPLGRGVNASDHKAQDFHSLLLRASGPVASQRSAIDIALVPPGADWPGSLAQHIPGQPLLVSMLPLPYDVIIKLLANLAGCWSRNVLLERRLRIHLLFPREFLVQNGGANLDALVADIDPRSRNKLFHL